MYIQQNGLVSSNNSSFYLLQYEYGWFINKWGHFMKGMSMANILLSINSYESSQLLFRFALQQFYKLYIYIIIYPIRKKNWKWLSTYNNVLQVCTDNIHSCNTCIYIYTVYNLIIIHLCIINRLFTPKYGMATGRLIRRQAGGSTSNCWFTLGYFNKL